MAKTRLVVSFGVVTALVAGGALGLFVACSSDDSSAGPPATAADATACTNDAGPVSVIGDGGPLIIAQQGSFFVGGRAAMLGCPDGGAPPPNDAGDDAGDGGGGSGGAGDGGCVSVPPVILTTPTGVQIPLDQNGSFEIEGTYVHFQIPAPAKSPMILVPGASLSGAVYESTPDGREGWATMFLRAGYPVYLADPVGSGRSAWARSPQVWNDQVIFFSKQFAWGNFRFGDPSGYSDDPAQRKPYPGQQFPIEALDNFYLYSGAYWGQRADRILAGYMQVMQKVGPAVFLAHSASGQLAIAAVTAHPELAKGLILVEPSGGGAFTPDAIQAVKKVPMLFVWGDFANAGPNFQSKLLSAQDVASLNQAGGDATMLDLPAAGITGNSHMSMLDKNNAVVAQKIVDWMAKHGL